MPTEKDSVSALSALKDELDKCTRCGECRVACPVFDVLRREKFASKGKVALVRAAANGELELSDSFYEALSQCLLCMACVDRCSSNVRTDLIVTAARAAFVERRGLSAAQRLVRKGLLSGPMVKRAASAAQRLLFSQLPERSGLRARFPLPWLRPGQVVPRLAAVPFRDTFRGRPRKPGPKGASETVILFTGCMANHAYTGVAQATVDVLEAVGVRVVVPEEQACCGAAMLNMGDRDTALAQARVNATALGAALEAHPRARIVTPCSTCTMALTRHHPELLADEALAETALAVAAASMDVSAYLADVVGPERLAARITAPLAKRITYHDPCHLARGLGVREQPRALLRLACGEHFTDMAEADRCCGMAGTYFLSNPGTSQTIQERKVGNVAASGADVVATGCPACILQLDDGLARAHSPARAEHTIELLAQAMGLKTDSE